MSAVLNMKDAFGTAYSLVVEVTSGLVTPHSVPEVSGLPVTYSNPMPVAPAAGALVDRSTTTVANASTLLMAANAARRLIALQSPQSVGIWWNRTGGVAGPNALGSYFLPPGQIYESGNFVGSNAVSYWCATAGLVLVASEG